MVRTNQSLRASMLGRLRVVEIAMFALFCLLGWRYIALKQDLTAALAAKHDQYVEAESRARATQQESRDLWRALKKSRMDDTIVLEGFSSGKPLRYDLSRLGTPLVLFSIDERCASCIENAPFVRRIPAIAGCPLEVVGIALNDTVSAQWQQQEIGFPLLASSSGGAWDALPLATPSRLIVLSTKGQIAGWWTGVFAPTYETEITRTLRDICNH